MSKLSPAVMPGTFLLLVYFIAFHTVLSHVVFYNEDHCLFLYSSEYLQHILHWNGVFYLLTSFLIQFFYWGWVGSLIIATLLTAVYFFSHRIICILTNSRDFLQLGIIPSLLLFFYLMDVEHSLSLIVEIDFWLLVSWVVLLAAKKLIKKTPRTLFAPKYSTIITIVCLCLYAGGAYAFFWKNYNYSQRRLLLVDHLARQGKWEEVLPYTNAFLMSGRTNNMMTYYHSMALYHTGQLPDQLLAYTQVLGPKSLYLAWDGSKDDCEYGGLLYEQLGQLSVVQRWEFESMVMYGNTARHLINLARYNIADGRPKVAQKFINLLKQSLFYQSKAEKLEKELPAGKVPGLHNALLGVKNEQHANFFNTSELIPNLEYILKYDPTNKMAYEYLMCELILSNQLTRFAELYPLASKFYKTVPMTFTEVMKYYENENK